jgi:peptidylprolyl isomerase
MAQAKNGDTVKVHYTGKLHDGTEFDSSTGGEPLEFTLGEGELIPGFEHAVIGMSPGESKTIEIASDQAYGPRQEEMVLVIERDQFPPHITPEIGQELELRHPDGQAVSVTVTQVSSTDVTLDANHPLAGKDLIFDIQLVGIA